MNLILLSLTMGYENASMNRHLFSLYVETVVYLKSHNTHSAFKKKTIKMVGPF